MSRRGPGDRNASAAGCAGASSIHRHRHTWPWNIASLDGPFPVHPQLVEEYQDTHGFAKTVQRFKKKRGFDTQPLSGFPEKVTEERTCGVSGCCNIMYYINEKGERKLKSTAGDILEYIRLVLLHDTSSRPVPAHSARVSDPTVLLKFCARDIDNFDPLYYLVPTHSDINK